MNTKLMQLAHSAGLDIGTNSVGMPIIITTKDGVLCDPEIALYAFALKIIDDNAASVRSTITEYENRLKQDLTTTSGTKATELTGGIAALKQLKRYFK